MHTTLRLIAGLAWLATAAPLAAQTFPPLPAAINRTARIEVEGDDGFRTMITATTQLRDVIDVCRGLRIFRTVDTITRQIAGGAARRPGGCFCEPQLALTFRRASGAVIFRLSVHSLTGKHLWASMAYVGSGVANSGFGAPIKRTTRDELSALAQRIRDKHVLRATTRWGRVERQGPGLVLRDRFGRAPLPLADATAEQIGQTLVIAGRLDGQGRLWLSSATAPSRTQVPLHISGRVDRPSRLSQWPVRVCLATRPLTAKAPVPRRPVVAVDKQGALALDVCASPGAAVRLLAWIDRDRDGVVDPREPHAVSAQVRLGADGIWRDATDQALGAHWRDVLLTLK